MPKLTKITLALTIGYFIIWLVGPLFIFPNSSVNSVFYGLPLWFWLSGLGGPLVLLTVLFYLTSKRIL